jgi:single-strand DNA-binding protein
MILTGVVRLGQDAEVKFTHAGTPVLSFSGAYNYGRKGEGGDRPTQWVRFSMFGERAEKLAEYLTKGSQVFVSCNDVKVRQYERRDGGAGVSLEAVVQELEFCGGGRREEGGETARAPAAARPAVSPAAADGLGFDDDIPF